MKKLNGKSVNAAHVFGTLTLEVVIDCVFGGEHYLSAEIMDPLWEKINKELNNYLLTELLFGKTVGFYFF